MSLECDLNKGCLLMRLYVSSDMTEPMSILNETLQLSTWMVPYQQDFAVNGVNCP